MGFITPTPPPFDVPEWASRPYLDRIRPLAQDWGVNGFGTPTAVYLLYVLKLVVFTVAAFAIIAASTPGLGGLGDVGDWWTEPVVWQKLAVWVALWEVVGLGSGSMPLTFRFLPPIGGIIYWLRPGTIRLPPFPDRVPGTRGTERTLVDVLLYTGLLAGGVALLLSDPTAQGVLDTTGIVVLLAFWGALGLRDKVPFLAARPEVYGFVLLVSLFGADDLIAGSQIVLFCIWWGAAASKLNRHFPFVVSVMISNTPWNRSRAMKRSLYRSHPGDMIPSRQAGLAAHSATVTEFALPLLLLLSDGGTLGAIAVVGMIAFHIHITSTFPLAVPLEWNLFMLFGIAYLFGHHAEVGPGDLGDPLLLAVLVLIGVVLPIVGNLRPDKVSFLPAMRYYAGNWATSQWLFRKDTEAEMRLDRRVRKSAPVVVEQLARVYDRETAELLLHKGLAFRSMHSHGRALAGLLPRAVDDIEAYNVREGELVAGVCVGWNFGDGHFHNEQLLEAVQARCSFAPGDLRVVMLESQPAHVQRQRYRIHDAATGLVEEGYVAVADMVSRQPWLDDSATIPVEVIGGAPGAPGRIA